MFRKRMGFLLSLLCMVLFAIPAFAKDSTSTITNISIKVDQNLSKLEAGSSLGNISESWMRYSGWKAAISMLFV